MLYRITEMSIDDYDDVAALWEKVEGIGLDKDVDSRPAIGRYLDRNPGLCFVARIGGELVGAVLCGHDGRRGYLHHLAVCPRHRGKGLGKQLVRHCLDGLRDQGVNKCNILVFVTNDTGLGFWKASGWSGRSDLVFMQKWTDDRQKEQ